MQPKWAKYLPWLVVAVITGSSLLSLALVFVRLHLNERNKQPLLDALRRKYPDLRFEGSVSYEKPNIYLSVYGETDPAKQASMRDWLAGVKAEHGMNQEVWLTFVSKEKHADEWPTLKL